MDLQRQESTLVQKHKVLCAKCCQISNTVYQNESFHSQESETKIITKYVFHLLVSFIKNWLRVIPCQMSKWVTPVFCISMKFGTLVDFSEKLGI